MDANLLEAMSVQDAQEKSAGTYRRAALKDIAVYGRVRCVIERPSVIPDNIENGDGYFCIVDAYALKCLGEDYFMEDSNYDVNRLYFTKGSLIAYIKEPERWVGRDIRLMGKSYYNRTYGCTIRRQGYVETAGISAFVFDKPKQDGHRVIYKLLCNTVDGLAVGSRDCKGTVLEEFMVKLSKSKNNEIPYNKSLDSIIPFTGVEDYTEVDVCLEETQQGMEEPKQQFQSVVRPAINSKTGRIDTSKIDMHLVYHLEGQPKSEYCESFREDIVRCGNSRDEWISNQLEIVNHMLESDEDDLIELEHSIRTGFVENIANNYSGVVGRGNARCKDYVSKFVHNCESLSMVNSGSEKLSESAKRIIREGCEELKKTVSSNPSCLLGDGSSIDSIPCIENVSLFAINAISVCTGVSYGSIESCFGYMRRTYSVTLNDFTGYLIHVPYLLGLVGCGLGLDDCDCIYYGVSVNSRSFDEYKELNDTFRDYMAMLNTLRSVCDGENDVCKGYGSDGSNTFVPLRLFKSATMHYNKRSSTNISNSWYPSGLDNISCLRKLFKNKYLGISSDQKDKILGENGSWFNEFRLGELESIGAVNTLEWYIALEGSIEQEYSIYTVFEKLGKESTGISLEHIVETIKDFEESRGFKLEPLQKDGVRLCMKKAGVLSGCAGSGKTTTSDCLTAVLEGYFPNKKIIYCTPTGKACRRLAEVVGGTVKTIHSQFHLGLGGGSLIPPSYVVNSKKSGEDCGTIYIMDEMAMCSTDLMFNVANNINNNDMIYFLGDIKQLPPVGNGCPFRALMDLLPCVELGVSKRAAAGSLVNYNTTLINFMSDGIPAPLMYDNSTFFSNPCDNASIVLQTVSVFQKFMDGSMNGTRYSEDDIQVISGYQKETKASSVAKLNPAIQNVLRKNNRLLFVREKRNADSKNYYLGDRVIYINSNSYDICRYIPDGYNKFKSVVTTGIVNGDVGKIVGVFPTEKIQFVECSISDYAEGSKLRGDMSDKDVQDLFALRSEREDTIRDDSAFVGKDLYFVAVQLYDTDLKMDVVVLLRARGKNLDGVLALSGGDLDNLDLAYALTCHKMQGSQSQVVIIPIESGSYSKFINRNMINTMVTRSQGIVCMIGDISGHGSALENGRRYVSSTKSHDILSILTGHEEWVTSNE